MSNSLFNSKKLAPGVQGISGVYSNNYAPISEASKIHCSPNNKEMDSTNFQSLSSHTSTPPLLQNKSSIKDPIFSKMQTQHLLKRFPPFELSYETIAHKKVFDSNHIGLAIPNGKKYFAWFTFYQDKDVCFLMEINREKKISYIQQLDIDFDPSLSLGTVLYGTLITETNETTTPLQGSVVLQTLLNTPNSSVETESSPLDFKQTLSSHSSTPKGLPHASRGFAEFQRNVTPNGSQRLASGEPRLCTILQNLNSSTPLISKHHSFFLIEEIYYYKGIQLKNRTFGEKLGYIDLLFTKNELSKTHNNFLFALPFIWGVYENIEEDILNDFEKRKNNIPYHVHHIQLRQLTKINPYLNITLNTILSKMNQREKEKNIIQPSNIIQKHNFTMDYTKPQYKYPTVFRVIPDIQYDIYHLYAYGKNHEPIYYNTAYIQNIEKSVFMNKLFRNIRENSNLDYIEESDDEDDFETIAIDKYVDLNKVLNMMCTFNTKFKRWVPIRVVEKEFKIVHISKLVNGYIM